MKRSKLFAIVLLVLMCASFISCTGEPVETQGTLATDSSASELSTLELTEETSVDSTELENTTKTTETTKTESSAAATEPEITSASSAQSDIPITMAGAVDKPPAYELLQNEAGGYIGVRFTYEDGSTYTWECPVESVVPPIVLFDFDNNRSFAGTCLIEYATAEEDLFDQVDLSNRKILYRHKNEEGITKQYAYGTGGYNTKSGLIRLDEKTGKPFLNEQGKVEYLWEGLADIPRDIFSKRCTGKIREIWPLKEGGIVPENPEFTTWIGNGIPPKWWEENGVFYAKVLERIDIPTVCRMRGYDVLYYSEEPVNNFTAEMALELFPDMIKEEYCVSDPEVKAEFSSFWQAYDSGFSFDYPIWGEYPPLANDTLIELSDVDYIRVYIYQVSPHYFVKVEVYNYMDIIEQTVMQQASSMLYY